MGRECDVAEIAPKEVGFLDGSRRWQRVLPLLIFLITAVGFHAREIILGESYLFSDHIHVMARLFDIYGSASPWSTLQWTEKLHLGFSYARESGGIFFHFPNSVLMWIFSPFQAVLISTLFWFFVAQTFAYRFLRLFDVSRPAALIGAVMFAFSGSVTRQYVHYDFVAIMSSTPLLFWLAESLARRLRLPYALMACLVIGNNFLIPNSQYISYQIPVVSVYYGVRVIQLYGFKKGALRWLAFAGILMFAVLLGAAFLLPFQDQIFDSVTSHGRGGGYATLVGSRWFRLFLLFHSLFAPEAVGSDVPHATIPSLAGHSWIWSIYLGMLPWFCCSGLWRVRHRIELLPLLCIAFLALLFFVPNLFVPILPDFRSIYGLIPGWNMFHHFERFLFLGVFSMSVLLTLSLDSWSRHPGRLGMLVPFFVLVTLGGLSISAWFFQSVPDLLPSSLRDFLNTLSVHSGGNYVRHMKPGSAMSVFLVLSFALLAARYWFRLPQSAFLWLGLIVLISDLMSYGLPIKPTIAVKNFLFPPPLLAQIVPQGKRFICATSQDSWVWNRDMSPFEARRSLGPSVNLYFGLSGVGGVTLPVLSEEEYQLFNLMLADIPSQRLWHRRKISDSSQFAEALSLWRLFSVEYLISDMDINDDVFSFVARDGPYRLYRIKNTLPRAYCSSSIEVVSDLEAFIDRLVEPRNVPLTAYVVSGQGFEQDKNFGEGIITSMYGGNTNLTVEVEARKGGTFLVLTDRWTKEWRAIVDGVLTRLHKVNGMQRGVVVPPGRHTVVFQYYDRELVIGLWLAGFSLLVICASSGWLVAGWFLRSRAGRMGDSD
jgi:hypothetical protein